LYEKSGTIALVLPGLTASCPASRLAGWPADKIVLNLEIFKIVYCMKYFEFLLCLTKLWCYYSCTNAFWSIFSFKTYTKVGFGHAKNSNAIFGCTTVLNGIGY